ncbi:LINE-1 retrotransposable element ORF1 protein [Larimichthys crocea]|uniref:LINE-1 retrotransposable element ORF1 protein n=1 Tax=Larimichthys crocea TaxID=215358 RepID=A0A6G0HFQ4_LARCR|nr:LINE-1 retrotransposable element ORF1 protein [Larimichthys crocea]
MERRTSKDADQDIATTEHGESELCGAKEEILLAIRSLKSEFSTRLDGFLTAVEEIKKELVDCTEKIKEAETRLSTEEDEQTKLKETVQTLDKRKTSLEDKVIDLETRSRLSNIRLVNLPEGAEVPDPCSFLEGWLPEALDLTPLRCPILLERAHRVGPRRDAGDPPRTLIMKYQSYKQKMLVMKAAKEKKDVLYKNKRVRLYNDLATEVHRQRKKYDNVRQHLRSLGLRHGIMPPAKLVVTYREQTHSVARSD